MEMQVKFTMTNVDRNLADQGGAGAHHTEETYQEQYHIIEDQGDMEDT